MRPRMHSTRDAVVDALVRGRPVSYSSQNFAVLTGLAYFHSDQLTPEQQERAPGSCSMNGRRYGPARTALSVGNGIAGTFDRPDGLSRVTGLLR